MKRFFTRTLGIALIAAGIAGLVFSIVGLVVLMRVEQRVGSAAMEQLELVEQTLEATAEGLALAETSLAHAADAAGSLENAIAGVGQAVGDASPALDSVANFLGEQLPATIETTQETLMSVATSAKIVDDILALITEVPFLGMEGYNPETPLHVGFQEVASSLDDVPASLGTAKDGLVTTIDNLEGLQGDFGGMAASIGELSTSLEDAQDVLAEYQGVVAKLQPLVTSVREGLPEWLRWLRLGLSLTLIWLGIAQIGLITQGWELVGRSGRTKR
jgi:ABC-type transporter Mla subunit MlaD